MAKRSLKQTTFAAEYVRGNGNGTQAAKRAGYAESSAHVRASELVRNSKVIAEIKRLTRKHDVNADRVLTRLDNLSVKAEEQGQIAAAIKAEELLGKSLGMWVERTISDVRVDVSIAHLDALREMMAARSRAPVSHITDVDSGDTDHE